MCVINHVLFQVEPMLMEIQENTLILWNKRNKDRYGKWKKETSKRTEETQKTKQVVGFEPEVVARVNRCQSFSSLIQIRNARVYNGTWGKCFPSQNRRDKDPVICHLTGRVAQRESTAFTRQGSLVQSQSRPPFYSLYYSSLAWFLTSDALCPLPFGTNLAHGGIMATIRKRGNRYHVQIRRRGQSITRTFDRLATAMDSEDWRGYWEASIYRRQWIRENHSFRTPRPLRKEDQLLLQRDNQTVTLINLHY